MLDDYRKDSENGLNDEERDEYRGAEEHISDNTQKEPVTFFGDAINKEENVSEEKEENVSEKTVGYEEEAAFTLPDDSAATDYGKEIQPQHGDTAQAADSQTSSVYHYTYQRGENATYLKDEAPQNQKTAEKGSDQIEAGSTRTEGGSARTEADSARNYEAYPIHNAAVPHEPGERVKMPFWKKAVSAAALAVIFGVVAGVTYRATGYIGDQYFTSSADTNSDKREALLGDGNQEEAPDAAQTDTASGEGNTAKVSTMTDISEIAEKVMPSVVAITNQSVQDISMFGFQSQQETYSSGSGIIIGLNEDEDELLIATNHHVINGAKSISVCFLDDTSTAVDAVVKGSEAADDLAVVAVKLSDVDSEVIGQIQIAELGDSDSVVVGEPAIAIGNALGYGQSVTYGIISAVNREVEVDGQSSILIQTDAAINPGNSGGALINKEGQVIGINAVKFASSTVEGMGYAIPISTAEPILDGLMSRKTRSVVSEKERSYLGVGGVNVNEDAIANFGMPAGVYISEVTEGYAAYEAGIRKGDILTHFDGVKITDFDSLKELMTKYAAGEEVELVIQSIENGDYVEKKLTVTLSKRPSE